MTITSSESTVMYSYDFFLFNCVSAHPEIRDNSIRQRKHSWEDIKRSLD